MPVSERARAALDTLLAKSICTCGHTGDGPLSDHVGAIGHGPCVIRDCGCQQFSWSRFTGAAEAIMDADRQRAASVTYPRLWLDVAKDRGVAVEPDGCINGAALAAVGIAIINGCPICEATVSVGDSYQIAADDPYAYCTDCAHARKEG